MFSAAENEHLIPSVTLNQFNQCAGLSTLIDRNNPLLNRVGRGVLGRDGDLNWIVNQIFRQCFDLG